MTKLRRTAGRSDFTVSKRSLFSGVQRPPTISGTALARGPTEVDAVRVAMVIHRQLGLQGVPWQLMLRCVTDTVRELSSGELIEVLATDPGSVRELDRWSRATGNAVLESSQFGNVLRFVVRKL